MTNLNDFLEQNFKIMHQIIDNFAVCEGEEKREGGKEEGEKREGGKGKEDREEHTE